MIQRREPTRLFTLGLSEHVPFRLGHGATLPSRPDLATAGLLGREVSLKPAMRSATSWMPVTIGYQPTRAGMS
jgi:hypothetical protein